MGCDLSVPVEQFEQKTGLNFTGTVESGSQRVPLDYVHANPMERWKRTLSASAEYHKNEKSMKREQLGKFKDMQRRRVMAEVIEAFKNPTGEPFVLVLDDMGAKILTTQIDMTDIMYPEGPVAMIEKLGVIRQPMPDMEAVYFVRPSPNSIKCILADFAKKDSHGKLRADWEKGDELYIDGQLGARSPDAQYKGIHLLFCGELHPAADKLLMNCPEVKRHLLSFTSTRLGIFPMESNYINFALGNSLSTLYGHDKSSNGVMDRHTNQLYEDIANKLLGVCVSLHELPIVRYLNHNPRSKPVVDKFCQKMFQHFKDNCQKPEEEEETWWYHQTEVKESESAIPNRAQLLVFDRAEDLSTPLHHEFSYQAMVMDLLSEDITEGPAQTSFEYRYSQKGSTTQRTMMLNDDNDVLWKAGKHKHLLDLATYVNEWEKNFHASEEWQLILKQKKGLLTRPKDQMKLLRTSNESIKKQEAVAKHTALAMKLFKMTKNNTIDDEPVLFEINDVETQIARGINRDKKSVSDDKVRNNLMKLLGRPEVEWNAKTRLLIMWFIHFGWKYKKATHDKVIESCDPPLRASDKTTINNLRFLNIPLHDYKYEKEEKKKLQTIRNLKQSRAKEIEQPKPTTLIEPDLVSIVSRHIDMSLNKSEYPWNDPLVKEPTQELIDLGELPINEPMWYTHKETGQTTQKGKSMRKARGIGGGSHRPARIGKSGFGGNLNLESVGKKHKSHKSLFGGNLNLESVAKKHKSLGSFGNSNGIESKNEHGNAQAPDVHDSNFQFEGSRIIVCIFGGVTYAELKGMYDLMRKTKREIIVCATGVLTSGKFLKVLSAMGGDDSYAQDDEEEDENIEVSMGDFLGEE